MRDDIEYMPLYGYNPLMYDYSKHMRDDIEAWLMKRYSYNDMTNIGFEERVYKTLLKEYSVVGSGMSESNSWIAEEKLCHNWALLKEACRYFGVDPNLDDMRECDLIIRQYLLSECLHEVLSGIYDKIEQWSKFAPASFWDRY